MNSQDTILDEITRKQLIWCGHVDRMDRTRLPKIMDNWKPEVRKKRGRLRRTWKDGIWDIYSDGWERSENGRVEQTKAMEYGSRKASPDTHTHTYIYIYIHTYIHTLVYLRIYIYDYVVFLIYCVL